MFAPRLVPRAEMPPFKCVLSGLIDGPFVDSGVPIESIPMQNPRAYFHPTAVHMLASAIGMVSKEEHEKAVTELEQLRIENEQLESDLADRDFVLDAVDGLTKQGMVVRKQPGRKAQKEPA